MDWRSCSRAAGGTVRLCLAPAKVAQNSSDDPGASLSCSRRPRVEKRALRNAACDPRWVPNPARQSRCGHVLPIDNDHASRRSRRERRTGIVGRSSRLTTFSRCARSRRQSRTVRPPALIRTSARARQLRWPLPSEQPDALRSRKSGSAIPRGDFRLCDPRRIKPPPAHQCAWRTRPKCIP